MRVVAVGTGQALAIGARGDADALLVHDRAGEDKFVADGHGIDRRDVMHNDFVIAGPASDPAGIKGVKDASEAFRRIAAAKAPFASRGDDSGTHRMELRLWKAAAVDPRSDPSYRELGSGMGPTLNTAAGLDAYVLCRPRDLGELPEPAEPRAARRRRSGPVQPLWQHPREPGEGPAYQGRRGADLARMAHLRTRPGGDRRLQGSGRAALLPERGRAARLKHDPEKWLPVFGKDHAQTRS